MGGMDEQTLYTIAALAALIVLLLVWRRLRNPTDHFIELDDDDGSGGRNPKDVKGVATAKLDKRPVANTGKRKKVMRVSEGCDHHFEITGIPADKMGTHVNVQCRKCGTNGTITVEESEALLRQRDDVRQAVRRARGD